MIALRLAAALAAGLSSLAFAQSPESQRAIERALIERDQQSAEFGAQLHGVDAVRELEALHARQLREAQTPSSADPETATRSLPAQRQRMAQERELRLPPPVVRVPPSPPPLPLPGGQRPGVDPVTPQGFAG